MIDYTFAPNISPKFLLKPILIQVNIVSDACYTGICHRGAIGHEDWGTTPVLQDKERYKEPD